MAERASVFEPLKALENPQELGFDAQRLVHLQASIQQDIDNHVYNGAALVVGRYGHTALASIQGYADRAADRALTPDDVLVTFSSGKQFTVAAVLRYVEKGLLQLHQPVAEIIPEFAVNGKAKINLAHLLTHTSGIPPFTPLGMVDTALGLPDRLRERICPVIVTDRSPGLLEESRSTERHQRIADLVQAALID